MATKKKTAAKKKSTKREIKAIPNTVKALLRAYASGALSKKKHRLQIDSFNDEVFIKVPTGAKDDEGNLVEGDYGEPETRDLFTMEINNFRDECCDALGIKYDIVD